MSDLQEKALYAEVVEKHIILVLSMIGGMIGADRAYKGNGFLALLKTITIGGLFIWFIFDIWISAIQAMSTWRKYNKYLSDEFKKTSPHTV